jgi:hypothetical protein
MHKGKGKHKESWPFLCGDKQPSLVKMNASQQIDQEGFTQKKRSGSNLNHIRTAHGHVITCCS